MSFKRLFPLFLMLLVGCSPDDVRDDGNRIRIHLDRSGEDALVRYYFGSYLNPTTDPVTAGLVEQVDGTWYLNSPLGVKGAAPALDSLFTSVGTGVLTWEVLSEFVANTWYEARSLPPSLPHLTEQVGSFREDSSWFRLTVTGSMSPYERRIHVPLEALMKALESGSASEDVLYPTGTWFIADHYDDGIVVETTAMVKRADSLWDYVAYDRAGQLANRIRKHDGDMQVPTQCLGCHNGNRAFEPERSFPAEAAPGPAGPRRIFVDDVYRDPVVTAALSEHMRRADTILGLYATVFLSGIRSHAVQGRASPEERALLDRYGLLP